MFICRSAHLCLSSPCPALPCSASPLASPLVHAGPVSACSAGPSLWVSGCICDGPVVMLCMVCCDGLAPFFTSLHGNKGFGPVWGSASTPCCGCCFGALPSCTEDSPWVIQLPCQDAARAACATLLGPCCFLPLSLLPSRAPSLFSLLASTCCLPCPFRFLASFAVLAAVVFFGLLFGAPLRRPFVVCVGVVLVLVVFWFVLTFLVCYLFVVVW